MNTYKCPYCEDGSVFLGEGVGYDKCDECNGTGRLEGEPCEHDNKQIECVPCLQAMLKESVRLLNGYGTHPNYEYVDEFLEKMNKIVDIGC